MYATVHGYTGQLTFYKLPEKAVHGYLVTCILRQLNDGVLKSLVLLPTILAQWGLYIHYRKTATRAVWSFSLSVCHTIYVSFCMSVCLSVSTIHIHMHIIGKLLYGVSVFLVCLSICSLSYYLSVCMSVCFYINRLSIFCPYLCRFMPFVYPCSLVYYFFPSVCLCLSVCLFLFAYVCVPVFLSVACHSVCFFLSIYPSFCPFIRLSVSLAICLCLSVCLIYVCLFLPVFCYSVLLSVWLFGSYIGIMAMVRPTNSWL